MNERDNIIRMAKAARGPITIQWWDMDAAALERFADLIRADAMEAATLAANESWTLVCKKMVELEREACAKVCETLEPVCYDTAGYTDCAFAIRARGNT